MASEQNVRVVDRSDPDFFLAEKIRILKPNDPLYSVAAEKIKILTANDPGYSTAKKVRIITPNYGSGNMNNYNSEYHSAKKCRLG